MNSSKRGCVYGFKLQSLDLVSIMERNFVGIFKCSVLLQCFFLIIPFISYVTQLLDTKSTDRKMTLLHYIALIVKEKYPELANFHNELHFVDKAAAGEFAI